MLNANVYEAREEQVVGHAARDFFAAVAQHANGIFTEELSTEGLVHVVLSYIRHAYLLQGDDVPTALVAWFILEIQRLERDEAEGLLQVLLFLCMEDAVVHCEHFILISRLVAQHYAHASTETDADAIQNAAFCLRSSRWSRPEEAIGPEN